MLPGASHGQALPRLTSSTPMICGASLGTRPQRCRGKRRAAMHHRRRSDQAGAPPSSPARVKSGAGFFSITRAQWCPGEGKGAEGDPAPYSHVDAPLRADAGHAGLRRSAGGDAGVAEIAAEAVGAAEGGTGAVGRAAGTAKNNRFWAEIGQTSSHSATASPGCSKRMEMPRGESPPSLRPISQRGCLTPCSSAKG